MSSFSTCPRCQQSLAASDVGAGVVRCVGCGSFACTGAATANLRRFLAVDDAVWRELLAVGGRGPACPGCSTVMRVVSLKGVLVDGCGACGALLLDPGELRRLTGRDEPPLPVPSFSSSSSSSSSAADEVVGYEPPEERLPGRVFVPPTQALKTFFGTTTWVQLSQQRHQRVAGLWSIDPGNRYVVRTSGGSGSIVRQEGAGALLARLFLAAFVRQRFLIRDPGDSPMLLVERHFEKMIMSRLDVFMDDAGDPGVKLGSVERNFAVLETRYELKDARGQVFARLIRPAMKLWQFRLETAAGVVSGAVAKEWSGLVTEWMSDADDFGVDFGPHPWTLEQRALIVSAALSIDLDLFERGNTSRGASVLDHLE